jgi:enoyl-CoA hydratase
VDAFVRCEVSDHIATVTVDRPPVNATTPEVIAQLHDTFAAFRTNRDARVAILRSAQERVFMAGADLKSGGTTSRDSGSRVTDATTGAECFRAVRECAIPVIAAVNGPAVGWGAELVASCDLIVASPEAAFWLPEINLGMLGGGCFLRPWLSRYRLRELAFTGAKVTAEELWRYGVINRLVPREELLQAAMELGTEIAGKSPIGMRLSKEALNRGEFLPTDDAYRIELDYVARAQTFEDSGEAARAYMEKRAPIFRWR